MSRSIQLYCHTLLLSLLKQFERAVEIDDLWTVGAFNVWGSATHQGPLAISTPHRFDLKPPV
jgi:hypothetical protein